MSDEEAREVYAAARLGQAVTLGSRPAVLVVDFSCGFTDPECTLGSDLTRRGRGDEAAARRRVGQGACR